MSNLKDIQGAIFDLDGTLIDSMHIWKDIDIEFLGRFGYDLPPDLQDKIENLFPIHLQEQYHLFHLIYFEKK